MKKIVSLVLVIVMICSTFAGLQITSAAADLPASGSCGENVTYTFDSATGELTISGSGAIYNYAFYENAQIKTAVIEEGITAIGEYAFSGCEEMTSIVLPNGLLRIGTNAFYCCTVLTINEIPYSVVSIGNYAFQGCEALTSIIIPDSLTSLGNGAFYGCSGLKDLTMPVSVNVVAGSNYGQYYDSSFSNCTNIEKITLTKGTGMMQNYSNDGYGPYPDYRYTPWYVSRSNLKELVIEDGVKNIGDYAFCNCSGLTNITIPNSVTSIGDGAFSGTGLTSISLHNQLTSIGSDAFRACSDLSDVHIGNNVNKIGASAFVDTAFINESSNWENGLLYLGNYLLASNFSGGTQSVSIKNGTVLIADGAFSAQVGLVNISLPETILYIGDSAFSNCTGLTKITIPDGVRTLKSGTFLNCSTIKELTMPASATIDYSMGSPFSGCCNIEKVTLTKGTGIMPDYSGDYHFTLRYDYQMTPWNISRNTLKELVLEEGIEYIGKYTFYDCSGPESITVPESVSSIGYNAFYNCKEVLYAGTASGAPWGAALTFAAKDENFLYADKEKTILQKCISTAESITIPKSVTSIGNNAFSGCSGLESITIPDSVTSIGNSAFSGCTGLESITIPDSVTSIGNSAFSGCTGLKELTMPASVNVATMISRDWDYYYKSVFENCTNIEKITLTKGTGRMENYNDDSAYDSRCSYFHTPWYLSRNTLKELVLEEGIEYIGSYAFYDCVGPESITIPESVTSIGYNAFYNCKEVHLTGTASGAPWGAKIAYAVKDGDFYYADKEKTNLQKCTCSAESIVIPETVTTIASDAFSGCSGMKELTMPASAKINYYAFAGCSNIEKITLTKGTGMMPNYDWSPDASYLDNYSQTPWYLSRNTLKELILEEGIEYIGRCTFCDCSGLTSITIPNSVTSIGRYAFYGCTGLTNITIPNSVTSLDEDTFYGCSALKEVTTPNLYYSEFENFGDCPDIEKLTITGGRVAESDFTIVEELGSRLKEVVVKSGVTVDYGAFTGCTQLERFTAEEGANFTSGEIFNKECPFFTNAANRENGVLYCGGFLVDASQFTEKQLSVKPGTVGIASNAFKDMTSLETVSLPDSLLAIGNAAFSGCAALKAVSIPQSMKSIGYEAFMGCKYLQTVVLPANVESVGNHAFWNCARLKSITVESADCKLSAEVIPGKTDIIGYEDSTAFEYAANYNHKFIAIGSSQEPGAGETSEIHSYQSTITQPTCITKGFTVYTCTKCGDTFRADYVAASATHDYKSVITKPSTCVQTGIKTFICTVCGDSYNELIPTTAHTIVEDEAVSPTCTKYGLSAGKYCSVCGKVFETQEKLEPLGHNFGTVVTPATLTANGVITHPCSRCDKADASEVIYAPKTFALAKTRYVYSGKTIAPAVTVKDSKGKVLVKGTDYTVAYKNNKNIGTASVAITFKGNYKGTKTLAFTIVPKATNLALAGAKKAFTAKWTKIAGVTGYQVQYATNAKFTGAKAVTVKGAAKYAQAIKNLKGGAKYYVRIRTYKTVGGKNYFSAWSAAKAVTTKK